MYVYMLAGHDEYGSKSPRVTLDRSKVPALLMRILGEGLAAWQRGDWLNRPFPEEIVAEYRDGLAKALVLSDEELASRETGEELADGWGGLHLYAIKIEEGL